MHNLLKKCVLIGPISFDREKVRNVNKLTSLQNGENGTGEMHLIAPPLKIDKVVSPPPKNFENEIHCQDSLNNYSKLGGLLDSFLSNASPRYFRVFVFIRSSMKNVDLDQRNWSSIARKWHHISSPKALKTNPVPVASFFARFHYFPKGCSLLVGWKVRDSSLASFSTFWKFCRFWDNWLPKDGTCFASQKKLSWLSRQLRLH